MDKKKLKSKWEKETYPDYCFLFAAADERDFSLPVSWLLVLQ